MIFEFQKANKLGKGGDTMKRLIALLLALLCIVIGVSACRGEGKEEETAQKPKEEVTTAKSLPDEAESETYEDPEGQNYGPIHGVQG